LQYTIKQNVHLTGTGLHSGAPVALRLRPAPAGHGIWFCRTDVTGVEARIPARYDAVVDTALNTTLGNDHGVTIGTVEHLMAALVGTGIHNLLIEVDGPEVPILDGSSRPFAQKIMAAGRAPCDAPLSFYRVCKPVRVMMGDAFAEILPANGVHMDYEIKFTDAAIGHQQKTADFANGTFLREFSDCRTFCRQSDVAAMQASGRAQGGTLDNAVVVDGDTVLSPGGFRRDDECVRHKMLDALGDLGLAGAPLMGRFRAIRGGHAMTNALLRKLMDTPGAVERIEASAEEIALLPGMDLTSQDLAAIG